MVTNNHVVDGADFVAVTLADGAEYDAAIVGTDPSTDLALLKIEGDGPFPTVAWGDSDSLRIGNWVVAVGGPFGLSGTVTAGIVSATDRDLHSGPYDDYIQFDAPINPGNSGGPVFDVSGHVIGVSTAIVSPSRGSVGIGFAVPASIAESVIDSLLNDGVVERGFLGVQIQEVTDDLAMALGLDEPTGALVADVRAGTPAELAGVQVGDLITGFDGHAVERMRDLPRLVAATAPGATVDMQVLRNGEAIVLPVTVGTLDAAGQQASAEPPAQGMLLGRLGLAVAPAEDYGWRGQDGKARGLVITEVRQDSAAEKADLRTGDVILAVGGHAVESAEDLATAIGAIAGEEGRSVALLIERDGDRRFVALPVDAS
ncbi:MAG: PDZ domain-containing protein [Alphaproteobacteria bacterium]